MSGKTKSILYILGALGLAIFFAVMGVRELMQAKQLAARGKSVTGSVVAEEDDVSGRMQTHTYYVTVNFKPEQGNPVTKKVKVSHATYKAANTGGPIKVWYLPEDPTICAAGEKVEMRYTSIVLSIIFAGFATFLTVTFNKGGDEDDADDAEEQNKQQASLLTMPRHEFAPVDPEEFDHLDLEFYDQGRRWLESLGYTFLADEENVSVRKASGTETLLRRLISHDRTTLATLFHLERFGKEAKVLALETWATNGGFVCTSNTAATGNIERPPQIDAHFFPEDTPLDKVLQGHESRLNAFYAQNPGVSAYALSSLEDVRRMGDEMQRIKSEFHSAKGVARAEQTGVGGESKAAR